MARNKKRTIVTIIGVMLSAALMCAVAGMAATFRDGMINYYETMYGSFYGKMANVPVENLSLITDNAHVVRAGVSLPVGTASIEEAGALMDEYSDNPYITVMAFDDVAFEDISINVTSGRLPKNDTEILINECVMPENWKVGDKITLDLGHRSLFGEDVGCTGTYYNINSLKNILGISEEEELTGDTIEDKVSREYTVVGVMSCPNDMVQIYGSGSFVCLTRMKDINTFSAYRDTKAFKAYVYYTFANALKFGEYTDEMQKAISEAVNNIEGGDPAEGLSDNDSFDADDNPDYKSEPSLFVSDNITLFRPEVYFVRNDIVRFYGGLGDEATMAVGILAAIIIMIIVVTSVYVISNSFRISVAEKKIQLGMLSSIGATKRQIKKIVLKEGLYIWAAGTTLGILLGAIVVVILTLIVQKLVGDAMKVDFRFVFPWWVCLIVIVMSAVTIYFASVIPARAASKISPIEAIRGNQEIKLRGKKLKTSKLTKKMFGIGGEIAAKNLKRSRRSYKTTVISLVIGVSTFIAIYSFVEYGNKINDLMYVDEDYDIRIINYGDDVDKKYEELQKISHLGGINDITSYKMVTGWLTKEYVSDDVDDSYNEYSDDGYYDVDLMVYDRDYFAKFLDEIGVKADDTSKVAVLEDDYFTMKDDNCDEKHNYIRDEKTDTIPIAVYGNQSDPRTDAPLFTKDIKITARSEKRPQGIEGADISATAYIIVSEDYFDPEINDAVNGLEMFIKTDTPDQVYKDIYDLLENDIMQNKSFVQNISEERKQLDRVVLMISIFLYGFIIVTTLIGVTNIFNTIHTNMNLRAKEFAMLKSVGMTGKEFDRMIRLESIMYGARSLLIGIPLGVILSYAIYLALSIKFDLGFIVPVVPVTISVIFVMLIVWMTMHLSLSKIKKQNIIETIRKQTY